jgi:CheY-like chemotaxis protein
VPNSARLLVVDDDDDIRTLVCLVLESEGYRAVPARDGLDALSLLGASPLPSLILLDLMMPRMDGEELRALKTQPEAVRIPVVVMLATTTRQTQALGVPGASSNRWMRTSCSAPSSGACVPDDRQAKRIDQRERSSARATHAGTGRAAVRAERDERIVPHIVAVIRRCRLPSAARAAAMVEGLDRLRRSHRRDAQAVVRSIGPMNSTSTPSWRCGGMPMPAASIRVVIATCACAKYSSNEAGRSIAQPAMAPLRGSASRPPPPPGGCADVAPPLRAGGLMRLNRTDRSRRCDQATAGATNGMFDDGRRYGP